MSNLKILRKKILTAAETVIRESRMIDFKEILDIDSKGDWCELIKDIIATANSGGGTLLIGVKDDGKKSGYPHKNFLDYDSAKVADKISSYLDIEYTDFEIIEIMRYDKKVACMICYPSLPPRIFKKPGDYSVENGKLKTAFQKGVLYTRKGTRSIPALSSDLTIMLNREINSRRKSWLGNIKKIVQSPYDYNVHVVSKGTAVTFSDSGTPVRLTNNPDAPEFKISSPDKLCPYNTTKTVEMINQKLKGRALINNYDILLLRYRYRIDKNSEYYYHPVSGSSQYSEKFISWVLEKYESDKKFFEKNRAEGRKRKE